MISSGVNESVDSPNRVNSEFSTPKDSNRNSSKNITKKKEFTKTPESIIKSMRTISESSLPGTIKKKFNQIFVKPEKLDEGENHTKLTDIILW